MLVSYLELSLVYFDAKIVKKIVNQYNKIKNIFDCATKSRKLIIINWC